MENNIIEKPKRNTFLTVWLILMLIGYSMSILIFFVIGKLVPLLIMNYPVWTIYFFGVMSIIGLILAILLFFWQKWAFYATCILVIIVLIINLVVLKSYSSIINLISPIILYFAMRPNWKDFK